MPDYSSSSTSPIFILCDKCYWCATYVNKSRRPVGNICPRCNIDTNELTSFPIVANELFSFDYNNKYEIELGFRPRRKDNSSHLNQDMTRALQEKSLDREDLQISKQQIIKEKVFSRY
jgi:hypothetical protein